MKMRYAALILLVLSGLPARAEEKKFVIDPVHSGVNFRIRHLYTMFPGRFDAFSGTITCDTNDLATMRVRGAVDVASISTANADRDKHLRTADFFDVARYPTATFESTEVRPGSGQAVTVRGTMTLHGVTAAVVFEGKVLGYGADMKGVNRVGFQGRGTIDRTKFGMAYNAPLASGITMLGNDVELTLDIEAAEVAALPAPSLEQQLDQLKSTGGKDLPPEVAAALEEAKAKIAAQQNVGGLEIGEKAPDFALPDTGDKPVTLSENLKQGPVVLVFYRGEWCPFCNLQLRALQEAYPEIRKLGASLLAVSPQKIEKSLVLENKDALTFPLLSDTDGKALRAYKLLYTIPAEMQRIYKDKYKIDLEEYNGPGHWELPVTATYVIGTDGLIAAGLVDLDYTKRMEPADILSALRAMRK